ncbi:unnamed protein product [Lactuca saligna]|uniref:Uncharacterized protein n=1 Tax=Lactuca saligna TaxID=75948 RepID=A0AA36E6M0_LACSI|nr:unnamed protein product [Lactuca saligna]
MPSLIRLSGCTSIAGHSSSRPPFNFRHPRRRLAPSSPPALQSKASGAHLDLYNDRFRRPASAIEASPSPISTPVADYHPRRRLLSDRRHQAHLELYRDRFSDQRSEQWFSIKYPSSFLQALLYLEFPLKLLAFVLQRASPSRSFRRFPTKTHPCSGYSPPKPTLLLLSLSRTTIDLLIPSQACIRLSLLQTTTILQHTATVTAPTAPLTTPEGEI